ncbi:MAG: ATP-binding protein [Leptospiraceae bacterium]|nr:ATP-binding protein [Leptospiraceae bacterium]
MNDRLRLQIPADARYANWARQSIYQLALLYGFSRQDAQDLKIVTGEALSNIILHAYEKRSGQFIFIEAMMQGHFIELRFQDFGKQNPVSKLHIRDLSDYRESGLGVYLISELSDYHYYDQSAAVGTILTVKKRLRS